MPSSGQGQWQDSRKAARVDSILDPTADFATGDSLGTLPSRVPIDDDTELPLSDICEHCRNLDIPGLLERRKRFRSSRRSLTQAANSAHCAFCRLIVAAFVDQYDVSDIANSPDDRQLWFRLRSANLASKWRPVAPLQSISIEIEVQPNFPRQRTSDFSLAASEVDRQQEYSTRYSKGRSKYSLLQRHLESFHRPGNVKKAAEVVKHPLPPQIDLAKIQQWLHTCDSYHHEYRDLDAPERSDFTKFASTGHFRLLDVSNGDIVVHRKPVRFVTLSYVWGTRQHSYDTVDGSGDGAFASLSSDRVHVAYTVNLATLPRTVLDAVTLVSDLGEKWLWVDKCCIDKDDDQDRHAIVSQMATIYENSYVTLVAAGNGDAQFGLARCGQNEAPLEQVAALPTTESQPVTIGLSPLTLPEALRRSAWSTRGWCFQEYMLSPRCLFLTANEAFFTCAKGLVRESYEIWYQGKRPVPQPMTSIYVGRMDEVHGKLMAGTAMELRHLFDAVSQFTCRNLTHLGDRFDAFVGFLQRFEGSVVPVDHIQALSGLTGRDLRRALLWSHEQMQEGEEKHSRIMEDARGSRALPSWSWVGWTGAVTWQPSSPGLEPRKWKLDFISKHDIVINYDTQRSDVYCRPWPAYPMPCDQPILPRTVLHLYTAVLRCHLSLHRTRQVWLLVVHSKDGSQARGFQVSFPTANPPSQKLCNLLEFTVIVLAPVDNARGICSLLAVQQDGDCTERLGMLQIRTNTGFGSQYFLEHFVRFEHAKQM